MSGIKLVGYSSDDELIFGNYNKKLSELFGPFIKKKNKQCKKRPKHFGESGYKCCYCDVVLVFEPHLPNTHTKDHLIPKSRGGKITMPCCNECNGEKGGLMLHSYIQMLEHEGQFLKNELLIKNQTKIRNAKRIELTIKPN